MKSSRRPFVRFRWVACFVSLLIVMPLSQSSASASSSAIDHFSIISLSCPVNDFCVALDGVGNYITYNGSKWTAPRKVAPGEYPDSLSCISRVDCLAAASQNSVSRGDVWRFNGSTWKLLNSASSDGWSDLTCAPSGYCFLLGTDDDGNLNSYIYSGASTAYTAHGIPLDMECSESNVCWGDWSADGDNLFALYERGGWVFKTPMDPGAKDSDEEVTCSSVSTCFGSETLPSGAVEFTIYNGHTWTIATTASASDGVNASCTSQNFCISADTSSDMLRFNGKKWKIQSIVVASGSHVNVVDCASSKFCMALAQKGDDVTTAYRYNGRNWEPSYD